MFPSQTYVCARNHSFFYKKRSGGLNIWFWFCVGNVNAPLWVRGRSWWWMFFGALCHRRCFRTRWLFSKKIWRWWQMALKTWLALLDLRELVRGGSMFQIVGEIWSPGCLNPSCHHCITCFCHCITTSLADLLSVCQWFFSTSCSQQLVTITQVCVTSWSAPPMTARGSGSRWVARSSLGHTPAVFKNPTLKKKQNLTFSKIQDLWKAFC